MTTREIELLDLLVRGLSNREIAMSMGIGTSTVKHHISHLNTKLLYVNSDKINSRILLAHYWSCELFQIGAGRE